MGVLAPEIIEISEGSTRNCKVSLQGKLEPSELLTGTPTIVEVDADNDVVTSGDLTISSAALTTAITDIGDEEDVPVARGVTFTVTGGLVDNDYADDIYLVRITCSTDAGQTVVLICRLRFVRHKNIEGGL